jgi:predicted O-methyltransferase YrrM
MPCYLLPYSFLLQFDGFFFISMDNSPDLEIIDGATFELRPHKRTPTKQQWICLRKNRRITNRYLELAEEFKNSRMVEIGVDQGGSTSFFAKLLKPKKLIAIELSSEPIKSVTDFLSEQDPEGRVEIHWGVNQADRIAIPNLLDSAFGTHALDLVVDDASHLLSPSIASFEMIFPRLRPGGLYVLEDWSCDHLAELGITQAIENDSDGKFLQSFSAAVMKSTGRRSPMSVLICQLVIASGRNPDWISELHISGGYCEVRRGSAEILPNTPIADYIGDIGQAVFAATTP